MVEMTVSELEAVSTLAMQSKRTRLHSMRSTQTLSDLAIVSRCVQVLGHLVNNAIKFSLPEGGNVILSARKQGNLSVSELPDLSFPTLCLHHDATCSLTCLCFHRLHRARRAFQVAVCWPSIQSHARIRCSVTSRALTSIALTSVLWNSDVKPFDIARAHGVSLTSTKLTSVSG